MIPPEAFALGDGPDACLVLHGFSGSPAEVRPIGEALARAGMRAVGPLLPGHRTTPADLARVSRGDLLAFARSALDGLAGARRIFLCGFSMGALLSLRLAAERPVNALALLSPAIRFSGASFLYTWLPPLPLFVSKGARDIAQVDEREGIPAAYDRVPLRWGRELRLLSREALRDAARIQRPSLILQGGLDRTVSLGGARALSAALPAELRVFPRSGHLLAVDAERAQVCSDVVQFFQGA